MCVYLKPINFESTRTCFLLKILTKVIATSPIQRCALGVGGAGRLFFTGIDRVNSKLLNAIDTGDARFSVCISQIGSFVLLVVSYLHAR